MRNKVASLLILVMIITFVGGSAFGGVSFVQSDTATQSNWRTNSQVETDGQYGTAGYVIYGLNAPEGDWFPGYDASSLTTAAADSAISLPGYISDIALLNGTGRWSGNGNFGQIEDPDNGNALTSTPVIAHGGNPYSFTITRSASPAFRLTIIYATGDGAVPTWTATVDDGTGAATGSVTALASPNIVYLVFDISGGSSDISIVSDATVPGFIAGFAFEPVIAASNLIPTDDATGVELDPTLTWTTGEDPVNPGTANPAITAHLVYFGTDPNTDDLPLVDTIAVENPAEYSPVTLDRDTTYYWRIDEQVADANDIKGNAQSFETVLSVPVVQAPLSSRIFVDPGTSAEISVVAVNPFTSNSTGLSYQWKKFVDGVDDTLVGGNSDTLTIAVDDTTAGSYYCTVTIDSNGAAVDSLLVSVAQRETIGYWPLDGNGDDASGNGWNNVNADSTSGWAAGVTGLAGDLAADFSASDPNDYLNLGNVPVAMSGEMTVSMWVMPRNIAQNFTGIMSKWGVGYDETPNTFWIGQHSTDGMLNVSAYLPTETRNTPAGALANDTWVHVVLTYDGSFMKTYIDGLVAASLAVNTDLPILDGDLLLGQVPTGAMGNYFSGLVDDVAIYNYALSADEAADIYVAAKGAVCVSRPEFDYDNDCVVGLSDFAIFAGQWLDCQLYPDCMTSIPDAQ